MGEPVMELTREKVEEILKRIQDSFGPVGSKIEAIRKLREGFGLGLKEAKDYIDAHWDDLDFIRKDLEERAGLGSETKIRVFEAPFFRLEIKGADVTQEQLHGFFSSVALELYIG